MGHILQASAEGQEGEEANGCEEKEKGEAPKQEIELRPTMTETNDSKNSSTKGLLTAAAAAIAAFLIFDRSGRTSIPGRANTKSEGDHGHESNEPNHPAANADPGVSKSVADFQSENSHQQAACKFVPKVDWWSRWIGVGTLVAAAIVACIYGGQLTVMQGQLSEMRQENRGWIAPTAATGTEPPAPQEFKFSVAFGNSGREPATDVRYAVKAVTSTELSQDVEKVVNDFDRSCRNEKEQMTELGASYPSSGSIYMLNANFPREFVENHKTPTVVGCFLYTTQRETHHTTFCFYWSSDKGPLNTWFFCPFGNNDAN